ncbi:hypothetical protein FQR65_LT19552 [Abscondita terminalis]|nr:hypothetical protein FQR65_LT19552 [Abscondita terminalis]
MMVYLTSPYKATSNLLREVAKNWAARSGRKITERRPCHYFRAMNAMLQWLMAVTPTRRFVAVESPVYFGFLQAIQSARLKAVEIPTHPIFGVDLMP